MTDDETGGGATKDPLTAGAAWIENIGKICACCWSFLTACGGCGQLPLHVMMIR